MPGAVGMCVCVRVCVYVYIYIYIHLCHVPLYLHAHAPFVAEVPTREPSPYIVLAISTSNHLQTPALLHILYNPYYRSAASQGRTVQCLCISLQTLGEGNNHNNAFFCSFCLILGLAVPNVESITLSIYASVLRLNLPLLLRDAFYINCASPFIDS